MKRWFYKLGEKSVKIGENPCHESSTRTLSEKVRTISSSFAKEATAFIRLGHFPEPPTTCHETDWHRKRPGKTWKFYIHDTTKYQYAIQLKVYLYKLNRQIFEFIEYKDPWFPANQCWMINFRNFLGSKSSQRLPRSRTKFHAGQAWPEPKEPSRTAVPCWDAPPNLRPARFATRFAPWMWGSGDDLQMISLW